MATPASYPPASRPVSMGANGMVTSAHPLASLAGLHVLLDGGNAFDAAVATAATLGVVEPHMSGIGGIGVALAYVARERRVRALNFSGRAPRAAEPSRFTEETKETGVLAPLVPGNVAGWLALHERYGSLDSERLFRPAIDYADNGFPVSSLNSFVIGESVSRLRLFPESAAAVLGRGDRASAPGSLLEMPRLAASLRMIAAGGQDAFYRGELAARIVSGSEAVGGLFAADDLAGYQAEWQDPIGVSYRGHDVFTPPPNSGGFQVLQTLKLMEGFGTDELAFLSPDSVHLLAEAIKLCVADRIEYGGDPDHVSAPLQRLLSDEYAATLCRRIDRQRAAPFSGVRHGRSVPEGAVGPGTPEGRDRGMTTHLAAADREGNVVSITQTLGAFFGSGVSVGDTGIFLNNGCYWFDTEEGGPNPIGPGRRVDFVLAPTHTIRDGRFYISLGMSGGYGILQSTPQMLMNVIDFRIDVQQAIDSPRFGCLQGLQLIIEEAFPPHVRRALAGRGHQMTLVDGYPMGLGAAHGIVVDSERGVFHGGADPRRDGVALGW